MKLPLTAYWRLLRRYLIPQRWAVLGMAVLLLASTGADLAGPQMLRLFVDAAADASTELSALTRTGVALLVVQLAGAATGILAAYWSQRVAWTAKNGLRADLAAHLLRLDLDFYQAHPPGALIERLDGDVRALGGFFSTFTVDILGALLLLTGILIAVWIEDARMALILLATSGAALGVLAWVRRRGVPHLQADRACQAGFWGYVGEVLGATEDLRSSGALGYVRRRTLDHLRGWLPPRVRSHVWGNSMWWVSAGVGVVAFTLTRGLGARLVLDGRMSLGTILMLFYYLESLLWGPLAALSNEMQTLQTAEVSIARVRELLQASSRLHDGTARLPGGALAVELRDVRFAYPGALGANALDDISFHLPAGRILGVLGRTGSGKTTLGRLLYRFYDPQCGRVLLGGVDLRQAQLDGLRARVGLVTQDVQLLAGTLRDNLCFYETRQAVPDERLVEALHALGLERWLARFPDWLDTPLSGATLSAGEAQLVALARVYLKDPGLIVLDEASSRLDPATEALLGGALDRLLAGRTALIIAHRLSTLARVDEVLILEQGRVVEYGERRSLSADPGSRLSALLRTGLEEGLP